ncbi:helix-turn-helix transcriptional regulator [uncultured Chryseobacterium sp.]|uniref:helix-turn-helix domain-containing protein n=1 Tax=uncultured Chryseobacterium sp. TaxID=259322 RepID=UPI0025862FB9|nr:helix-turn-helix transcriptional regulator [uncultured Chryseobacterium sp.]
MQKEKLRNTRKRKGFTQQQVADYIATDVSNYSRKESGDVKIYPDEWNKIARFLEVPLEEIYESEEVTQINNFDNITSSNSFGVNNGILNFNIPEYILETQKDLIELLKKENKRLEEELLKRKR